jgi:hypothetical protein
MATYDETQKYYANSRNKQLRDILRAEFGPRKYRICGNDVHVYGMMPNSNKEGFYLLGSIKQVCADRGF